MNTVITLATKDLRLLLRDKATTFWVIGFPLLMAVFFGSVFSGMGDSMSGMRLILVDQDQSESSIQFVEELGKSTALRTVALPLDSAQQRVRIGKASAYLLIPKGYGTAQGFGGSAKAKLELGIDPARQVERGYLQGIIMQSYFALLQRQFTDPALMKKHLRASLDSLRADGETANELGPLTSFLGSMDQFYSWLDTVPKTTAADSAAAGNDAFMSGPELDIVPMTADRAFPKSSYEITFPSSLMWALIAVTAAFAVSIVQERTRGTFLRLRIAPLTRTHILAGKGIACFASSLVVCILLLIVGGLVFKVRLDNTIMLLTAVLCSVFCFCGLMMLISVMGKTEQAVGGISWAVLLVFSMTGGGMIPLAVMPGWMRTISNFSPVKWGIYSVEGAIWRGFSWGEMMLPLGVLIAIGLVTFTIGVTILARTDN